MVTEQELQAHAEERQAPRVTLDQVIGNILSERYFYDGTLTICVITLKNGFKLIGESACADPKMYKKDIGDRLAYEDAKRKIWSLMGYALKEKVALVAAATTPTEPEFRTYVGTKVVHAFPMTRLEYNKLRGWELPADENGDDEGFIVEYADGGKANTPGFKGYISWSPKDVFERAYGKL